MRHGTGAAEYLIGVSAAGVLVNLVLMLLNLLPILPLDGGRIVTSLLPRRAAGSYRASSSRFGLPLLLLLLRPDQRLQLREPDPQPAGAANPTR